ncbi:hypothetical protein VB264_05255 [Arcicella aquatica]|uniref:Uncharacterized protein n=1 Tax=Arcicella aquatica TaxID=217141 RepID=A0ABU5QKB1_9BACT|nr:hypothetical protein [Arcicella aquatica]MEA5257184.1 hypothetical protein [Arcicella aquatica]
MNIQTAAVKEQSKVRKNMERYIQVTGKSEADYNAWATQIGRQMHINTLDKLICAKMNIYSISHLSYLSTEINEYMTPDLVDVYLFENSINPLEIGKMWKDAKLDAMAWMDKNSVIDEFLIPFPKADFERWGDKNVLGDVSKSWFSKSGLNLDTQVQEMNTVTGLGIEIEDVIEFVKTYRRNSYVSPPAQKVKALEERWRALTSFAVKDYYIDHLIKANSYQPTIETNDVPF